MHIGELKRMIPFSWQISEKDNLVMPTSGSINAISVETGIKSMIATAVNARFVDLLKSSASIIRIKLDGINHDPKKTMICRI